MEGLKNVFRFTSSRTRLFSRIFFRCAHSSVSNRPIKPIPATVFATQKKRDTITELLQGHGFSQGQITRMFNSPQMILSLTEKDIWDNLTCWCLTFELNQKLLDTLASYPELLTLDPEYINARIKELLTLFTNKDVQKLLVTSPQVFLDDFSEITEKIEYIVHKMRVEQKSIIKTSALQYSFHHVKCRHNFMFRSGFYKLQKDEEKLHVPPLNKILSRNIETFMNLTKLTKEEYLVFCDYYADELEEGEMKELEEDDDFEED